MHLQETSKIRNNGEERWKRALGTFMINVYVYQLDYRDSLTVHTLNV